MRSTSARRALVTCGRRWFSCKPSPAANRPLEPLAKRTTEAARPTQLQPPRPAAVAANAKSARPVHLDRPVVTVVLVLRDVQATLVLRAEMELCCRPHHRRRRARSVLQAHRDLRDHPAPRVFQVRKETQARQAKMARPVFLDRLVRKDLRVHPVCRAKRVLQAILARRSTVPRQGHRVRRDRPALRARPVLLERTDSLDDLVRQVLKEIQERRVPMASPVHQARPARAVPLVTPDRATTARSPAPVQDTPSTRSIHCCIFLYNLWWSFCKHTQCLSCVNQIFSKFGNKELLLF